jgi:small-conductance mechanosensitive channel
MDFLPLFGKNYRMNNQEVINLDELLNQWSKQLALFWQDQKPWQILAFGVALLVSFGLTRMVRVRIKGLDLERNNRLGGIVFSGSCAFILLLFNAFFNPAHHAILLIRAIDLMATLWVLRTGVYLLHDVLRWHRLTVGVQTFFVRLVWLFFALHELGLTDPLKKLLQDLQIHVSGSTISLLQVIEAIVFITLAIIIALWLGNLVERRLVNYELLESHIRVIVIKLSRGVLLVLTVIIVLPLVGIDPTFLSVLGGGLGIGLGLALQKVVSNFVSGFIILMDRSVRLGDVVAIDGQQGTVIHLDARSITLSGGDGTLSIIPNETFVTQVIVNYTANKVGVSRHFSVSVAFDNDLVLIHDLLFNILVQHPQVLESPNPQVKLERFSGNEVIYLLQYWVADANIDEGRMRSELLQSIRADFVAHHTALLMDVTKSIIRL